MRPLVLLLALLLALPFAAAQGQGPPDERPGGEGNQTLRECRGQQQRECVEAYCEENDDRRCQRLGDCQRADCAELSRACQADDPRSQRACQELQQLDEARSQARHVAFELDREGRRLLNYTVDGQLLLTSIAYGQGDEEVEVHQRGSRIRLESGDARIEIHDTPTGAFWFRGDNDSLLLSFPDDVVITPSPQGHVASYATRTAILAGPLDVEGTNATATSAFRFFSPAGRGPAGAADALANATARGHLGAELDVASGDITTYDDVHVNVSRPETIHGNDTLRILLDAELETGKTFVIDIDPADLGGPELVLRYFDVHGANETEVVFRQASGLPDVLDPTDDAGQPEYWVVEDAQGIHVMASVPHWSAHIIEIASVGEFLVQPSVLLGAAAGVIGVAAAGTAMFWPRRREELV